MRMTVNYVGDTDGARLACSKGSWIDSTNERSIKRGGTEFGNISMTSRKIVDQAEPKFSEMITKCACLCKTIMFFMLLTSLC